MSTLGHLFDLAEQICYVQCGFCSTILLVSVPRSSMSMVVSVRCGHCAGLLSVNMMKASFVPFHLFASLSHHHQYLDNNDPKEEVLKEQILVADEEETSKGADTLFILNSFDNEEYLQQTCVNHIVNKPPEKRQRAPSAYNRFIKEEITRLKAMYPNMPHKEAFSTAAKNWANFPQVHNNEDGESCALQEEEMATSDATDRVDAESNWFREREVSRHCTL